MIRLSEGTAACLGLGSARMDAYPTTAYLLLGDSCLKQCLFCSRGSGSETERLGRVGWPRFSLKELVSGLSHEKAAGLKRICLQSARYAGGIEAAAEMILFLKRISVLPVSVSAWIENESELETLFSAGADRISIALDVVNEEAYSRIRGGSFTGRLKLLLSCAEKYRGRLTTHLICGLGESEEETLALIEQLIRADISVALFAFMPLKGTAMAGYPRPPVEQYRRIQAGKYLLQNNAADYSSFTFRDGRLTSFGLAGEKLRKELRGGKAFKTGGCAGCNRPYYNERPGGTIYNYHRPLSGAEEVEALNELLSSLSFKKPA